MRSRWIRTGCICAFMLIASTRWAFPVTTTGAILGTVFDPAGAAVPGAQVLITNTATGHTRTFTTDSTGGYEVLDLQPSPYSITVKASGFKTKEITGIVLEVDQKARVDMMLEVGAVSEKIEVSGSAPLVNTENASMGTVITNTRVVSLPLNGRSFVTLAQLVPGANTGFGTVNWEGVGLSVNGQRGEDNNFMLDGVDNNVQTVGSQDLSISIDAIQEFKVQASNYSAESGRAGGALISVATKSGTNELHGTLFEFHRDNHLQARNYFDASQPGLYIQNQFGGSIGGPVVLPHVYNGKQRTFFFFDTELLRYRQASPILASVPPLPFRTGDFSSLPTPIIDPSTGRQFANNTIPPNQISPIAQKVLALWPNPNMPDQFSLPNFFRGGRNMNNDTQWTARVDQQLGGKDSLFGRFSLRNQLSSYPGFSPVAGGGQGENPVRNLAINETHIFSPTAVNEFRAGYNRRQTNTLIESSSIGHNYAQDLGLPIITNRPTDFGWPQFRISPYDTGGDDNIDPRLRLDQAAQLIDNFTVIRGKHTVKTGIEVRRTYLYDSVAQFRRGVYTFSSDMFTGNAFANFLLGLPANTLISNPPLNNYIHYTDLDPYVQDDWKLSRRLTLDAGLRWSYIEPWTEKYNHDTSYDPATGQLIRLGQAGYPRGLYYTNWTNLAPRFGFAYRPSAGGKTVLRGGYGLFYVVQQGNPPFDQSQNPPYGGYGLQYFANINDPTVLTLSNPFPGVGTATTPQFPQLFVLDLHNKDGYSQQWDFTAQRELGKNWVVEAAYVGTTGTHLLMRPDINQPTPGLGDPQTRRPNSDFGRIYYNSCQASSNYHSLQMRVERRFAAGFSILSAYTFSKAIDNDDLAWQIPQNSYDLRAERSLSNFDIRHRFVTSYLYELPVGPGKKYAASAPKGVTKLIEGWKVAGITVFSSGPPSTPVLPYDNPNVGYEFSVARPDRIGNGTLTNRSWHAYWDKGAFVAPAPYSFGNGGRNILIGPGINNWDIGLLKDTRIKEGQDLEFRAEFFDAFNHPQMSNFPNSTFDPTATPYGGTFGEVTSYNPPRIIQLGLKYIF